MGRTSSRDEPPYSLSEQEDGSVETACLSESVVV